MRNTSADDATAHSAQCVIHARPRRRGQFYWEWQSLDGAVRSRTAFTYFYDCLADARRHGYDVDPAEVARQLRGSRLSIQIVAKNRIRETQT